MWTFILGHGVYSAGKLAVHGDPVKNNVLLLDNQYQGCDWEKLLSNWCYWENVVFHRDGGGEKTWTRTGVGGS